MTESEIRSWMRFRLYQKAGIFEHKFKITFPDYSTLKKIRWSNKFEQYMRNRLIVGAFRHHHVELKQSLNFNNIGEAIKRLRKYLKTKDPELLVDVANLCLLEFVKLNEPNIQGKECDEHTPVLDFKNIVY